MARPIDPKLVELARRMQEERPAPQGQSRPSVLEAAVVPLAEFRYLGYSLRFMHEFAKRAGIQISYNGLVSWAKRRLGTETGPDSLAARIVQHAVDQGAYNSPHFRPNRQAIPLAGAPASLPPATPTPSPRTPANPAPVSANPEKAARLAVLDQGMQHFTSPFKHIREHKEQRNSE
jgi:hypothetical protein